MNPLPVVCFLLSLAAVSVSAQPVVPADPSLPHYHPGAPVSGKLVGVAGMDTVTGMMTAWNEAFRKYHPGAEIALEVKEIAPEERIALGPNTAEVFHPTHRVYEDTYGYEPFSVRFCQAAYILKSHVCAIGVYVNKANPLNQISLAQLDAIYSSERRRGFPSDLTTWGHLGLTGEWADKPIRFYGFYWREDVTTYFRKLVMFDAPFKDSYQVPGNDLKRSKLVYAQDIVKGMTADPYGITFGNATYYPSDQVKPLALEDHGVVSPFTLDEVASGRYPLRRYLYFYVNRKPGQPLDPLTKEFLSFILSKEGQDLVEKDHYLPLPPAVLAAERARLE
ncbi:MAG: substrate-binding domain-containing protein [Opitutaceae bacterium]|nr:substrate-binding domain-containing protein [Opitutaceae bacterium]